MEFVACRRTGMGGEAGRGGGRGEVRLRDGIVNRGPE